VTRAAWWALAVMACIGGGCASSPPLHYFMLSETAPAARLTESTDQVPVRVDRVTIPTELDRSQLVRRIDANRVQIVDSDRWAAPLDDMIRRVLSADLAMRLPPSLVVDPYEPFSAEPRQSLSVDIQHFYGDTSCAVSLRAAWVLKPPRAPSVRGTEEISLPAGRACPDASALPQAMSEALGQLSDRIATALTSQPPQGRQTPPSSR